MVNRGTGDNPIWQREYFSFGFAHKANTEREPDAKVIDQIYRHEMQPRISSAGKIAYKPMGAS